MKIELRAVTKGSRRAPVLPATSTTFEAGRATLVEAETEERPAVLGLIASGRMRPDSGTVLLDGRPDAAAIRRVTALVDAPDVCDPAPDVTVLGLVEEELMFAGRVSNVVTARRWAADHGFAARVRTPISAIAPRERVTLLLELAALRADVRALVLVSPDRHGGDPREWWDVAQDFAARDYAVLAVAGRAAALLLDDAASAAPVAAATSPSPTTPPAPPTQITTTEPTDPHNTTAEHPGATEPGPGATEPGPDAEPEPDADAEPDAEPEPDAPPTQITTTDATDPHNTTGEHPNTAEPGSRGGATTRAEPDDTAEEDAR